MKKVVLLDRDGTIVQDPPDERITDMSKIQLFDDTVSALRKLSDAGYCAILITNQDTVAEGLISEDEFWRLNQEIVKRISKSGIKVLKTYMCGHALAQNCECRKPKPKMLLQAIKDFDLDAHNTFMVGDRPTDIQAGKSAGVKTVFVKTARVKKEAPDADYEANSLTEAIEHIISST